MLSDVLFVFIRLFKEVDRVSWLLFLLCCVIRWPSLTMAAPVHSTDEPVVDVTEEMATTESIADDSVMEEPQLPPASPGNNAQIESSNLHI